MVCMLQALSVTHTLHAVAAVETVQFACCRYHMEEMVPELEDLEKRGFFSAAELKQVAAKRTDFEYLLKRRAPLKEDYLR
jgi:U3 small nucleolar RNA-associated protein 6